MDKVQKFISENHHQLGYIMQEASRQWIENDPVGALTVGDCNIVVQKNGQYHELLKKMERYEQALKEIANMPFNLRENMVNISRKALKGGGE